MSRPVARPEMLAQFYRNLAVPHACALGKRIFKNHFYKTGYLNAADKKAFVEDIDRIEWRYTLKPDTINIPRFEDKTHEYVEVEVLQITLRSDKRARRIARVIQKTIPYPMLIIFAHDDRIALNMAEKRISQADSNKVVVEVMHDTGWITPGAPGQWEADFLADFRVTRFSYRNLFDFYQDMVKRIIALNCGVHTGRYSLEAENEGGSGERLRKLRMIEKLLKESAEVRNKLKGEKNLGTRVLLNTRVKQMTDRIDAIKMEI